MRTRIKICGITDVDNATVAAAAGADAIGLVFHRPSSRFVELEQAALIRRTLAPFVAGVAVLVNPDADWVDQIIAQVNPTHLQFHGAETPEFCASFNKPYIKAVPITDKTDLAAVETRHRNAQGLLLDTHSVDVAGGSGRTFDWRYAQYESTLPVMLAGGLTADNVHCALLQVAPFAVDVSSGVETDGRKDADKILRFCRAVRRHDAR